ncbi:MAG: nitrogenase [Thermoanaerobacteraceae bacterium]|nr:nitrogenase [Thermoanaerobacteraceae bacterium]
MTGDIAVCLDEQGETTSLDGRVTVAVFRRGDGGWYVLKQKDLLLSAAMGMQELRREMHRLIDFLAGCRILVGRSIGGVPYFELEKAQFSTWEITGKPADFLDHIFSREQAPPAVPEEGGTFPVSGERGGATGRPQEKGLLPAPVEITPGCYRISLKEIQKKTAGVTSKQVLLPFLRRGGFDRLEIICQHMPPWLEMELLAGNLDGHVQKNDNGEITITITPEYCRDGE